MPSLKTIIAITILYVLFVIYSVHSHAEALKTIVKVKITAPKDGIKNKLIDILSVTDNDDGTVSTFIVACGSLLEVIADKESMLTQDPVIVRVANNAIMQACK